MHCNFCFSPHTNVDKITSFCRRQSLLLNNSYLDNTDPQVCHLFQRFRRPSVHRQRPEQQRHDWQRRDPRPQDCPQRRR
jgi:hypothetical protein